MTTVPQSVFITTVAFVHEGGKKKRPCDFFVCTNTARYRLSLNVEGMRGESRVCESCYEYLLGHKTRELATGH